MNNVIDLDVTELSRVIGGCDPDDLDHLMTLEAAEEAALTGLGATGSTGSYPSGTSVLRGDIRGQASATSR